MSGKPCIMICQNTRAYTLYHNRKGVKDYFNGATVLDDFIMCINQREIYTIHKYVKGQTAVDYFKKYIDPHYTIIYSYEDYLECLTDIYADYFEDHEQYDNEEL